MDKLELAAAAFLGGVVFAFMGWVDSKEPFDWRKFAASVLRSLVPSVVVGLTFQFVPPLSIGHLMEAFVLGGGGEVLLNRTLGAFGNGSFPFSPPK